MSDLLPNPTIRITATETIEYSQDYDLEYLEDYLGKPIKEFPTLEAFTQAVQAFAHSGHGGTFAEDLERHGDVQGQTWVGEFVDETEA